MNLLMSRLNCTQNPNKEISKREYGVWMIKNIKILNNPLSLDIYVHSLNKKSCRSLPFDWR